MSNLPHDIDDDLDFAEDGHTEEEIGDEIPHEKRVLRTQAYDKSVSDLITMMADDIRLDPHYQRSYIWDNKRASLLIESILLNVPIPVIYVEEDSDNRWNVVDGLQRLNSLKRFFANEFKLTGLEVLPELNRLQYSTLNPKAQRILKNGILRIIVILQESHPEIKYDIFLRLNRGSVRLNEQELRNCLYRGKFNEFLKILRAIPAFQKMLGLQKIHPRLVDAELVLRALAFIENFDHQNQILTNYVGKMKGFLNWFMHKNRDATPVQLQKMHEAFSNSLACTFEVFGEKAFRRIDASGRAEPLVNRAIFDIVMVGFAVYTPHQVQARRNEILEAYIRLTDSDKEFFESITYGTSDKIRVEYRLKLWTTELANIMG